MARKMSLLRWVGLATLTAGLGGCSQTPDNLFVLLGDADDKPTSIEVITDQGVQKLDRPGEATGFDRPGAAPIEPIALDRRQIERAFGGAFSAAPPDLQTFLLYFRTGGAQLTDASEAMIEDVIAAVRATDVPVVGVIGHTDREGSATLNAALARKRAETIRDLLVDRGLSADLIEVDSHGEGNPIVPTDDGVAEPQNRRVEITIR